MDKRLEKLQSLSGNKIEADGWPPENGGGKTLIVTYESGRKLLVAVVGFIALPLLYFLATSDDLVIHLMGICGIVVDIYFLLECLLTVSISFDQGKIVKRRLYLGETVIPAQWAVMTVDKYTIQFCHGSISNKRERISISRFMVSELAGDNVVEYAQKQYRIQLREDRNSTEESPKFEGSGAGKGRRISSLILEQFSSALSSYKTAFAFMVVYTAFVVIAVGISDGFPGFAPELPASFIRGAAVVLALAAYPLLKKLNPADSTGAAGFNQYGLTWEQKFKGVGSRSFGSALMINGIALLGFILFFLLGNLLDFYAFLAVACFYYFDFFPRLSTWEQFAGRGKELPADTAEASSQMPIPSRRRSLQVSLVLMGALAVTSYGESQHYLYKNKKDCLDDWGSEQNCQEPSSGSHYYRSGYYYGPRYGSSGGRGVRSAGAVSVSRGGFGSLGSFHASFGG